MQHGSLSGRDFQSTYGPAVQVLAWISTTVIWTQSPLDALGLMIFAFSAASAVLIAAMLLLCDRISWPQAAVLYGFSIFLNLFYDVLDIRTALLLLNVVFAYRVIAAGTLSQCTSWAAATGFLCFLSQLVTFGLGIYAAIAIVCTLTAGIALTRNAEVLHGAGYRTPTAVYAHGFLTVNGQKMSKSRGTLIAARTWLDHLSAEYLRSY